MMKLCRNSIESIVDRAVKEFMNDLDSPAVVDFFWKGHNVEAYFEWDPSRYTYFVSRFLVIYPNCVMRYQLDDDFDLSIALCE